MTITLACAAIAIICAADPRIAATAGKPSAQRGPSFVPAQAAGQNTASMWNGRWQGTTVSGHPLVLQLELQGERMKGKLTVGRQTANITDGKVVGDTFTLATGAIDGRKVGGKGRRVGETIELTIDGVKEPLTLTRTK